jgi:molecular chaperone IbpA
MSKLFLNDPFTARYIGFDEFFKDFDKFINNGQLNSDSYPPHNIINNGDGTHTIELAIAGYKKDDLLITLEGRELCIAGDQTNRIGSDETAKAFKQRGISARKFKQRFTLADNVEVSDVILEDGILSVQLNMKEKKKSNIQKFEINKK